VKKCVAASSAINHAERQRQWRRGVSSIGCGGASAFSPHRSIWQCQRWQRRKRIAGNIAKRGKAALSFGASWHRKSGVIGGGGGVSALASSWLSWRGAGGGGYGGVI